MTALRRVLEMVAAGELRVEGATVAGLALALDIALGAYATGDADKNAHGKSRSCK